jgi:hypothetical protein
MKADGENLEARWSRHGTAAAAAAHTLSAQNQRARLCRRLQLRISPHAESSKSNPGSACRSVSVSLSRPLSTPLGLLSWPQIRKFGSTAQYGQARIASQPEDEIERFRRRRALKSTLQFEGVALAWQIWGPFGRDHRLNRGNFYSALPKLLGSETLPSKFRERDYTEQHGLTCFKSTPLFPSPPTVHRKAQIGQAKVRDSDRKHAATKGCRRVLVPIRKGGHRIVVQMGAAED